MAIRGDTKTTGLDLAGAEPVAQADILPGGELDLLGDVGLGGDIDAIGSGIPAAGMDQPWQEVGVLTRNTPPKRPGYEQRWVRVQTADDKPDTANLRKRLLEGWRPRTADSIPGGAVYATAHDRQFGTIIAMSGMVLMEMPTAAQAALQQRNRARTDYLARAAEGEGSPVAAFNADRDNRDGRMAHMSMRTSTQTAVGVEAASLVDD